MIITDKWAFCANPKAASTAIQKLLPINAGQQPIENHAPLRQIKDMSNDRFVFAFIRNPFDRLVSMFKPKSKEAHIHHMMTIKDKIGQNPPINQHQYCCIDGKIAVDYLGHTETFADDFREICKIIGVKYKYGIANKGNHKPWQEYYNDEAMAKVREVFALDFEIGGY